MGGGVALLRACVSWVYAQPLPGHAAWLFPEQCLPAHGLAWRDVPLSPSPALPQVSQICFSADTREPQHVFSETLLPLEEKLL